MDQVTEAEHAVLFALYLEHHVRPNRLLDLRELYVRHNMSFPMEWLLGSAMRWERVGWVKSYRGMDGTAAKLNSASLTDALRAILAAIGATILTASGQKEEISADAPPPAWLNVPEGWKWFTLEHADLGRDRRAPRDRQLVKLADGTDEHARIALEIERLRTNLLGDNTLDVGERDRLVASTSAANEYWKATELRYVQIKVGILMHLDELAEVAKSKAYEAVVAGAITMVRSFLNKHSGLDI